MMLPARPVVRLALTVGGGMVAGAWGLGDVLRPAGLESVSIVYVGDTILHRDSTVPFSVVVEAGGTPLDRPRLKLWSSDTSVFDLTAGQDSLVAKSKNGTATLTIRLESSIQIGRAHVWTPGTL